MISLEKEVKILQLSKSIPAGIHQVGLIASIVQVNVCTVKTIIAAGAVRSHQLQREARKKRVAEKLPYRTQYDGTPIPRGKPKRCECGRIVKMPCLACWLESQQKR